MYTGAASKPEILLDQKSLPSTEIQIIIIGIVVIIIIIIKFGAYKVMFFVDETGSC